MKNKKRAKLKGKKIKKLRIIIYKSKAFKVMRKLNNSLGLNKIVKVSKKNKRKILRTKCYMN